MVGGVGVGVGEVLLVEEVAFGLIEKCCSVGGLVVGDGVLVEELAFGLCCRVGGLLPTTGSLFVRVLVFE